MFYIIDDFCKEFSKIESKKSLLDGKNHIAEHVNGIVIKTEKLYRQSPHKDIIETRDDINRFLLIFTTINDRT